MSEEFFPLFISIQYNPFLFEQKKGVAVLIAPPAHLDYISTVCACDVVK
jgi:hypothetical protein